MMRDLKRFALTSITVSMALACVYWDTWDKMFVQRRGLLVGGGGYSIALPRVGAPKGTPGGGAGGGSHYFLFEYTAQGTCP